MTPSQNSNVTETIAAIATPPGYGGVGIVRLSGPAAYAIASTITGKNLSPRLATHCGFSDDTRVLDEGLALFFKGPNSFTGEDVVELQGHGGPVVQDLLLKAVIASGARLARPGEFSERAFLNDKLDLTQAEAVADLISAQSESAARSALNSLQGAFSEQINQLLQQLIQLRTYVEAAIDFPDEEVDFLSDKAVTDGFAQLVMQLQQVLSSAKQGVCLQEGVRLVLLGRPNTGKSSLLNALAGIDKAIVTEIPGTTRDLIQTQITLDGLPVHITDTAGLRESPDAIEQEGIRRALAELAHADLVLLIVDSGACPVADEAAEVTRLLAGHHCSAPVLVVRNKADLSGESVGEVSAEQRVVLSAKTGEGIEALRQAIRRLAGVQSASDSVFSARRRHLTALEEALSAILQGKHVLEQSRAGELAAEELRLAQMALSKITGQYSSDDLLGEIFSSFCIGK